MAEITTLDRASVTNIDDIANVIRPCRDVEDRLFQADSVLVQQKIDLYEKPGLEIQDVLAWLG